METSVAETLRNGTVFITGSTGFLGKVLTEKLLRSCPVKTIAILVRSKKGLDAHQRITDIYKQTIFDRLRREKPDFMNNIKIINGKIDELLTDVTLADQKWLIENVNFVFHCAATVKFNERLESARKINIQGTENLMLLASRMKCLKGFVHVSTAYSHCPRNEIKEEFYTVPVVAKDLKNILSQDESTYSNILENWPNTYTFTKAITEHLISTNDYRLPISIFRPSIIGCTMSEPEPGWLDNTNGPTGVITPIIIGFLRALPVDFDKVADVIPVDYTVNGLISVMWDTVNRYDKDPNLKTKEPKIYNYVSSVESPLTWGIYINEIHKNYRKDPPLRSVWYIFYIFYTNLWVGHILRFLLHRTPAAFMDILLFIRGKQTKMLKLYGKSDYLLDSLRVFTTRQWKFDNNNTKEIWSLLSQEDRSTFRFTFEKFNWKTYIQNYFYGIRRHVLHEDLSNTKKASAKNRTLFWLHYTFAVLIISFTFQICLVLRRYFF